MATQLGRERAPDTAGLLTRLDGIAATIEAAEEMLAEFRKDRDDVIRELVDAGFSEREIARAARTTGARIHQIKTKETTCPS